MPVASCLCGLWCGIPDASTALHGMLPITTASVSRFCAKSAAGPIAPCEKACCVVCRIGALSYAMSICLSVLHGIAAPPPPVGAADAMNFDEAGLEDETAWDVAAVVTAAKVAPDGDARRQALRLLSALAHWQPAAALEHVMEVSRLDASALLRSQRYVVQHRALWKSPLQHATAAQSNRFDVLCTLAPICHVYAVASPQDLSGNGIECR